jgi:hypothetical protein
MWMVEITEEFSLFHVNWSKAILKSLGKVLIGIFL